MTSESEIRARIEESRKELLDLSLRNRLLNWRPLTTRGVEIVGENAAQVFTKLVADRRPMTFLPAVDDEVSNAYPLWEDTPELVFSADQTDNRLQTTETSANLQKRLLNTYRLANTSIQETGVNTLFLGLGMLKWYESDFSQEDRKAPLVLVPVRLERTSVRARFRLEYTGDDLGVNLSLLEKVRQDFALDLPGVDVLEPVDGQEIDVAGYISQVEDVVHRSALSRWNVEPDRIVLGFLLLQQAADVSRTWGIRRRPTTKQSSHCSETTDSRSLGLTLETTKAWIIDSHPATCFTCSMPIRPRL